MKSYSLPLLTIIVPCFNEEAVLEKSTETFMALLKRMIIDGQISKNSHVLFVDDGSKDNTWTLISRFASSSSLIRGIKLSRNRGHQNALLAGLLEAEGDLMVSVDADLQDDINTIMEMVKSANNGAEIVYGVRSSRETDSLFKRISAETFYRFLRALGVEVVFNHADFRLMSRRAVESFRQFGEVNLFLRGMVPMLGFRADVVFYERAARLAGESKYPLRKMLSLAWEGVTSLSVQPLRFITLIGVLVSVISFLGGLWVLLSALSGHSIEGWASVMLGIFLLGGIQLLALGVIGEYVGKIYVETKKRPRFIIEERL